MGRGSVRKSRKITLDIPAGVDTGSMMSLRGEGEPGLKGGSNGDLYIYMRVSLISCLSVKASTCAMK